MPPRRTEVDLLAEAIETGRRDPVAVGALRSAAAIVGDRRAAATGPASIEPSRSSSIVARSGGGGGASPRDRIARDPGRRRRGARPGRLGDDRRLHPGRDLPAAERAAAARRRAVGGRPRLVGRRPVRAARPPALERQAVRRHHARHRPAARRARPAATARRPAPARPRPPVPDRRGDRRGPRGRLVRGRRSPTSLRAAGLDEVDGWPVFDLVFLGIGPDGHLLSVFPGSAALDSPDLALAIPAPTHIEPHIERVTLNPAVLAVAREVLVVAYGADKAAGHRARSSGRSATRAAGRASSPGAPGATWILDEAAARGCSRADGDRPDAEPRLVIASARRHADRRLHVRATGRRSSSSTARPPTTRRSASSGRCSAPDVPSTRSIGAAGAPRATRCRTPSSASSRTSRRSPTRSPRTRAAPVDVVGHSYGGRCCARGRAADRRRSGGSSRYEGAPTPAGASYHPAGIEARLRERLAAGDRDGALATFMTEVVGMSRGGPRRVPGGPGLAAPRGRGRHDPARARGRGRPGRVARAARGGPPAGPPDPRRGEPAGLPRRDRGARRAARATAGSSSSTARATPPTTPIPTPSSARSVTSSSVPTSVG